jgi:peptide/nickel transport system permease protein
VSIVGSASESLARILKLSSASKTLQDLLRIRSFKMGFAGILALVIFALMARLMISYEMTYPDPLKPSMPPNPENPLGTDLLGRDILAQIVYGLPNSLAVGIIAGAIGTLLGTFIGLLAGYFRGFIDSVLRLFTDVFLALPSLLVLVLIASYFRGVDYVGIALIISVFNWAWPARQIRAQTLQPQRGILCI